MKALLIYSRLTGNSLFAKKIGYVRKRLEEKFDLTIVETTTYDELKEWCVKACRNFDYLLFVGGDGTVNSIINFIADEPKKPIIGYIPGGTTNDFARNFYLKGKIDYALNTIINGVPVPFDICKVNNKYFAYVLACGAFSDISYTAKRKSKKYIGSLAYYLLALQRVVIPRKVLGTINCEGKTFHVNTPFLLILNSVRVGGFRVNFKNKMNDGKFHVFVTKQGLFNGLLHYMFFKLRTLKITTDHLSFSFDNSPMAWCIDGEKFDTGNVEVTCIHNALKILVPSKKAKKYN